MADPMNDTVRATVSAMDAIDAIVRLTYGDPVGMAMRLRTFARTSVPAHSEMWVVKKAHDVLNDIEWEREHAPLNVAAGLPADFVG